MSPKEALQLHDELDDLWCTMEHIKERHGYNDQACNILYSMQAIINTYQHDVVYPIAVKAIEETDN